MKVLDKGEIELLDSMGKDETIARAAWVSYGKQGDERGDKEVKRLVNYLMKHQHGTPFEHVVFQFYIKAPIFIAREWFRHRIGSFNEISSRYVTFEPEFYMPEKFRVKEETNKQGSKIPEDKENFNLWNSVANADLTEGYTLSYNKYLALKEQGVANELARLLLPLGTYTQWWWTVNLRSLFNFMALRSYPTAQWEIQEYSRALESIVKEKVPYAYEAWEANGRNAP